MYLVVLDEALAHGGHVAAPAGAGPVVELLVGRALLRHTAALARPADISESPTSRVVFLVQNRKPYPGPAHFKYCVNTISGVYSLTHHR